MRFSALLKDMAALENGSADFGDTPSEKAQAFVAQIRGGPVAKALPRLVDDMSRLARGQSATAVVTRVDAAEAEARRKAAGRLALAALVEQINDSIRGGLVSGVEAAKLDGLIARVMEGLNT